MAKKTESLNRWWLFAAAVILLVAAFLMKLFPVFAFVAFAPLFVLAGSDGENENRWENAELILIALVIGFFSATMFDVSQLLRMVLLGIVFTMPFVLFSKVRGSLGPLTGDFLIIIFWLALEYLLLKSGQGRRTIFLADLIGLKEGWIKWNHHTGYLGGSLWILLVNWLMAKTFLRGKFNGILMMMVLILIAAPLWYAWQHPAEVISRNQMIALYENAASGASAYGNRGEWIVRTAAWVSVLVVLFSIVRTRTKKKN